MWPTVRYILHAIEILSFVGVLAKQSADHPRLDQRTSLWSRYRIVVSVEYHGLLIQPSFFQFVFLMCLMVLCLDFNLINVFFISF